MSRGWAVQTNNGIVLLGDFLTVMRCRRTTETRPKLNWRRNFCQSRACVVKFCGLQRLLVGTIYGQLTSIGCTAIFDAHLNCMAWCLTRPLLG